MLLPERVLDLSPFAGRPLWSIVAGGVDRRGPGGPSRLDDLARCSLVVARRRHGMWHGPLAGFRIAAGLRRGWLVELLDVDVRPWADDDAAAIFDWGVASVLEYARVFGAEPPAQRRGGAALDAITIPGSIGGPQVERWLAEQGAQPQSSGHT